MEIPLRPINPSGVCLFKLQSFRHTVLTTMKNQCYLLNYFLSSNRSMKSRVIKSCVLRGRCLKRTYKRRNNVFKQQYVPSCIYTWIAYIIYFKKCIVLKLIVMQHTPLVGLGRCTTFEVYTQTQSLTCGIVHLSCI